MGASEDETTHATRVSESTLSRALPLLVQKLSKLCRRVHKTTRTFVRTILVLHSTVGTVVHSHV